MSPPRDRDPDDPPPVAPRDGSHDASRDVPRDPRTSSHDVPPDDPPPAAPWDGSRDDPPDVPRDPHTSSRDVPADDPPDAFRPARGLKGAFLQTVAAAFLPARIPRHVPASVRQELAMADGERLGVLVSSPAGPPYGRLVLLHGLGGSAQSRYMRRTLGLASARGFAVARVQFRGAERGASRRPAFHNAGRSEDLAALLEGIVWPDGAPGTPLAAIGFSLGGAVLLKHLADAGAATPLAGAVAISAPLDLAACLAALEEPRNRLYHRYYVRRLRRAVRVTLRVHPGSWPALDRTMNAVRRIDTRYVAPDAGYDSAESYYRGASSLPRLAQVAIPTLLVSSHDDPFIPVSMFTELPRTGGPIETLLTARGGHVGYLSGGVRGLRFWAGEAALDWLETRLGGSGRRGARG